MNSFKLHLLLVIVLLVSVSVAGQTQPNLENGYKPYGSYDGSNIDTINTMNGNLMLHLPMPFSYPQRGGKINPLNLLTISSKNWAVQCGPPQIGAPATCYWSLGPRGVGALAAEAGSGLGFDYTMDLSVHRQTTTETDNLLSASYDAHDYSLSTADGAKHSLFASANAVLDSNGDPLSYDAGDLSGYHLDLTGPNSATGIPAGGVLTDRDGNRYQISFFGPCSKPVTNNNNNGSTSIVTCTQASRTSTITDVNGNVLTLLGTGLSDTMGRPFKTFAGPTPTTDLSDCVSNTWPLASATLNNYASANGTTSQFKLCYANVNIQTAFGATAAPAGPDGSLVPVIEGQNVPDVPHPFIAPMLVTVIMPDGTSWKFDYDSYGNVTHLGLPLGGSIDYAWQTIAAPSCGSLTTVSRAVKSRTINDNNGHSFNWQYNYYGAFANGTMTNTVTDPLGNDTDHVFTALNGLCTLAYETSTQEYRGTGNSRQLLKQVDTHYQTALGQEALFVFADSYKTTVYPSGKVKLVQRTPDPGLGDRSQPTFGLVSQELEYDWGQGAPGPLLRETDTVYQWQKDSRYLTARLIDLRASVIVVDPNAANNTKQGCLVDGAGTTKACAAETDYTYDEAGYLQSYEAANGPLPAGTHVAAPNPVRGNLTSVGRWLNTTGSMVVSHTNWYDTGMMYQSIDPLNHASTETYDPFYAGAFPTKTCDALNHCVSGTYDFTTGLLTSFTNQNATTAASGSTAGDAAHTVNYGYDNFSRIKSANFPDGGQVSFNYSLPNVFPVSVEKVKKINATLDDHSFAYLDGLGRPFKGVHRTPNGDATVITTYDAFDRAINVTNPFISTSDPTYGEIQTQYDALGRTAQVTKQDGSFTMAVYNQSGSVSSGDCTTTTDEAGKLRRTCSDGLGRLVEVDEPNPNAAATAATASVNIVGAEQTAMASSTVPVPGSGFESPSMGSGTGAYQYHPAGSNWTFSPGNGLSSGGFTGGAGLSANGTGFTNLNPSAPEGQQVAFVQGGSANYFLQSLSGFQAGGSYTVSFKAAQRGSNAQDFDVYLDSTLLGTFRPANSTYATFSTNAFTTTAGTHTLKFAGRDSAGGDNTAFIDDVRVTGTAPVSDSGTVSLTINGGAPYIYTYGANDTTGTIVNGLVSQIAADGAALVTATATVNNNITVPGLGFESPSVGSGANAFQYHPAGSNWTFSPGNGVSNGVFTGGAGLSANGTGFTNLNPPAPEGLQVVFLQGGSANYFSQALSGFQAGGSYTVNFKAAQRGNNIQDFDVYLDTMLLGTFRPASNTYATFSTNAFTTTAGTHTLKFVGRDSAGGDNTAFIDAVQLIATQGSTLNLTSKATGAAINGYSLTANVTQMVNATSTSFSATATAFSGGRDASGLNSNPYVTQYSYDTLGNLTCVVQKGADTTPFTTCAAAPATWRPRSFTYDSISRLLTATNPESGIITYSYDAVGNVLQKTSPAANQTGTARTTLSFCYDELNRPTGKAYSAQSCQNGRLPAGAAIVSYNYDAGTNGLGQLTSLSDQAGSASYVYDALGRVTTEQRTIGNISKSTSYDYNLDGSVSVIHYPSGAAVTYTPDAAGRTVSVTDPVNGINYVTGASYNPDNSIGGFVNGNSGTFAGITNAFNYNVRLQPVNISATTPGQQKVFAIGYDFHLGNGTSGSDNGNVWGITNFKDPDRSESFTYDALNRLTSAQTAGTDCSAVLVDGSTKNWGNNYSYDAWGNLLAKTPTKCGALNASWAVNTKNQLLNSVDAASHPINTYTFDAAGNLTNDGILSYNYDAENRLTGANGFTYTYDAGGNRVKKSNGTTGTLYWNALVGVIAETDLAGNNPKEYIFFNGARVARRDSNGQVFYFFSDHLKTTAVITDSAGNIKSESDFDPWGSERRVVDNFNNTYKFTGKERDGETGLDYFGARYYSSGMGRFMTPDWAAKAVAVPYANYGNPQSLNLYSYVQNNPTTFGDPDGHTEKQNVAPEVNGPPVVHDNGDHTYTATQVVETKSEFTVVTLPDGTLGTQQSIVTTTYSATFDSSNQLVEGTANSTTSGTVNTYDANGKLASSKSVPGPKLGLSGKDAKVGDLQQAARHWWNAKVGDGLIVAGTAVAGAGKIMEETGSKRRGKIVQAVGGAVLGAGAVVNSTGVTWQNVAAWGQALSPCDEHACIPMP